jgi:hypothetical protein
MKTNTLVIFLLSLIAYALCDKAGVKTVIKIDTVVEAERKFLPKFLAQIGELDIPDQEFSVDATLFTIYAYLTHIHFSIKNLLAQNINIYFLEPNIIRINTAFISGAGSFDIRFKAGFVSESDHVNVNVNRIDCQADIVLTQTETSTPGKFLPSGYVKDINFPIFEFDFDIHGSIIAGVVDLIKSLIKDKIKNEIINALVSNIKSESGKIIDAAVKKLPIYFNINDMGLDIDLSLTTPPVIKNNYLILNANGAVVNHNVPESLIPPFVIPENLPDYDQSGKNAQVFLTEYSVNTALNTLYLSHLLEYRVKSDDIPSDSPFKLDTTWLNTIFNGMIDVYGKDKKVDILCMSSNNPIVTINQQLHCESRAICSLLVLLDSGNYDQALKFETSIHADGKASLKELGIVDAEILSINLSDSKILETKIQGATVTGIEMVFNFTAKIMIPIVNTKYLSNIKVNIPSFQGVEFTNSFMNTESGFAEVEVTPEFTNAFGQDLLREISNKVPESKFLAIVWLD